MILAALLDIEDWLRGLMIGLGFLFAVPGFLVAVKLEQVAGYYECKKCGYKYVPTYKGVIGAMHMGRTRYLNCPNCNEKSWQKKVIKK